MWKVKKNKTRPLNYNSKNRIRRQDIEKNVVENGSIYITNKNIFKKYKRRLGGKIITYIMDSWSIFEIDNKKDLEIISSFLSSKLIKSNKIIIPKKK
jgi:CMP-N-acetylneuraminic acid synthetase